MSEIEAASDTVARLLRTNTRVVLDNGALASVYVSDEWQNNDAFKSGDGQVTVALAESADQKIDLTGKIRQIQQVVRVNVWATDTLNTVESGKSLRSKIVDEINRIIRQNRSKPNQTIYSYVGTGPNGEGSRAFLGDSEAAPNGAWQELSDSDYQKLWQSDGNRVQVNCTESGKCAVLLFGFKVESRKNTVKQATLSFLGSGTTPAGDGVTVKAFDQTQNAWVGAQTNQTGADEALTLTLAADLANYIDSQGFMWFLAKTTQPSDGTVPATLWCDHTALIATVNGISYCDVASYRNLDRTDFKPPIYRTEFTVKSWFIENIGE